tara:strand:- start:508 stop:672 length:165 start_codon:yes stop_codon:yes gene_type:complete
MSLLEHKRLAERLHPRAPTRVLALLIERDDNRKERTVAMKRLVAQPCGGIIVIV